MKYIYWKGLLTKKEYRNNKAAYRHSVGRIGKSIILLATVVRRIKGKLGFEINTPDKTFLFRAQAIYSALDLNTASYYTPPFAGMSDLDQCIIDYKESLDNLTLGTVLGAEGAKNAAKTKLKDVLDDALVYVNKLAKNNQTNAVEIITGARMEVMKAGKQDKPDFAVHHGLSSGSIELKARAEKVDSKYVKATYYWQFSIDDGKTWESLENTLVAKTTATGMLVGIPTIFRKRTKSTKGGLSAWCPPISITPQ